jgi:hypothetical protein
MSDTNKRGTDIRATISGPVSGQVAIGTNITQTQTVMPAPDLVSDRHEAAPLSLTGRQELEFSEALRAAFPDPDRLDQVLRFYLDMNRADITLKSNYQGRVFDILVDAKAKNWTHQLLVAARQASPNNPELLAFAQHFSLATTIVSVDNASVTAPVATGALEKKIREANGFLDVARWRDMLGRLEGRVCKIEVEGNGTGTGFLVGTDVVMTNYHVMEDVIKGTIPPDNVTLRFDFKRLANDATGKGTVHRLARDWRIHDSPYSAVDLGDPTTGLQEVDHLDYALVRTETRVAEEPIGGAANADTGAPLRGFIERPSKAHDFKTKPALFILQHPDGEPLKLALDTESVIAVNDNGARVRYRTATEAGSSGSPCFDADWNLVALHHLGDRNWQNPKFNQGIPFASIVALLEKAGKAHALGQQSNPPWSQARGT